MLCVFEGLDVRHMLCVFEGLDVRAGGWVGRAGAHGGWVAGGVFLQTGEVRMPGRLQPFL